jgi:hypothetical protein
MSPFVLGGASKSLLGAARLDRLEFQGLANERLADARALCAAQRWSGAYYLAGYAVECGLKACVLAYIQGHMEVIFGSRKYVDDCWTHDLAKLVERAGLEDRLKLATAHDAGLLRNWQVVKDWTEISRYKTKSEQDAKDLLAAIEDPGNGVLAWVRNFW